MSVDEVLVSTSGFTSPSLYAFCQRSMARAAPGSWSTMTLFFASKTPAPSEWQSLRNCGMVPDPLLFQFGRYGVSLILSRLSLAACSISSSQLFAGPLMPACWSIGSLYMRMKMLVK